MAKQVREEWNVNLGDFSYCNVVFENNKISINHGEMTKLGKFKSLKGNLLEKPYEIPLNGQNAILYLSGGKPILTLDGIDCATGQPYEPIKIPGWNWVFYVLYIINFIILIGGALGGAAWTGCAYLSARIASDQKKSMAVRVLLCVALYIGTSIVGLILALLIMSLRG